MSWLGRILVFLVFIVALVETYFLVNVYVARTNWKAEAEKYKKAHAEAIAAREKDFREGQAEKEAYTRMYASEQNRADALAKTNDDIAAGGRKANTAYAKLEKDFTDTDVQNQIIGSNLKITLDEMDNTRKRSNTLEDRVVILVLAKEAADRERLRAENEKKLAEALAADMSQKVETLTAQVNELRTTGGGGGAAAVLRSIEKPPAPLPENIRGTVLRNMTAGNFVHISIGIDAGLEPGSRLDVYRETGGGQYLGTLVVTNTLQPKEAVAEFRPARGVPVAQLRPDELPRKGDIVGRLR